jgi:hypothetical protein
MKFWTKLSILPAVVLLMAVTHTDYNHSVNFGNYKSYSWIKVEAGNSLWQARIQHAVDNELQAKGWNLVPSGGDAAASAVGSVTNQQQLETQRPGWRLVLEGVRRWNRDHDCREYSRGNLMVDIFDGRTKKLIWRGTAEKVLSGQPEKNEKKLQDTVDDMFKKFSPRSKG